MRRKRLQHCAYTLCHMFCGWRLMNSYAELAQLGSGNLVIEPISGLCFFNGMLINQLSIASELQHWLKKDLDEHNIPLSGIKNACLDVNLDLNRLPTPAKSGGSFYIGKDGKPVEQGEFFSLVVTGKSAITTDEVTYESSVSHREQWPVGWPNA